MQNNDEILTINNNYLILLNAICKAIVYIAFCIFYIRFFGYSYFAPDKDYTMDIITILGVLVLVFIATIISLKGKVKFELSEIISSQDTIKNYEIDRVIFYMNLNYFSIYKENLKFLFMPLSVLLMLILAILAMKGIYALLYIIFCFLFIFIIVECFYRIIICKSCYSNMIIISGKKYIIVRYITKKKYELIKKYFQSNLDIDLDDKERKMFLNLSEIYK